MLGCPGAPDSIEHYWDCPKFVPHVAAMLHTMVPPAPFGRLGLSSPSRDAFLFPAAAYELYKAIRAQTLRAGHPVLSESAAEALLPAARFSLFR